MASEREQRREGKEGNRWVNKRPSAEELAAWFKDNVEIEEGLDSADYVGGVTLIPSKEKSVEVVGWDAQNSPRMEDVWDLVFTPYIRVETRLKYFHDLMAADDKVVGVIWPNRVEAQDPGLPPGFFYAITRTGERAGVRYICCSMKLTVFRAGTLKEEKIVVDKRTGAQAIRRTGEVVLDPPGGTKIVPVLDSYGKADTNALMKAETGAVGRALGMAGMLVIPGTGLATAEDMQELSAPGGGAGGEAEEAELPSDLPPAPGSSVDAEQKLRDETQAAIARMEIHPPTKAEFKAWAVERGFVRLSEVTEPALRGMARKAEKMATTAEERANGGGDESSTEQEGG